jgi:hypothetical protein
MEETRIVINTECRVYLVPEREAAGGTFRDNPCGQRAIKVQRACTVSSYTQLTEMVEYFPVWAGVKTPSTAVRLPTNEIH